MRRSSADQRQSLGGLFGDQSGGFAQAAGHGAALIDEVGVYICCEGFGAEHRIIEQSARKLMAQGIAPALVALHRVLGHQGTQPRAGSDHP